jgi:phenylacetate-CoA ligase
MTGYPELSEEERFPLLTANGRKLLHRMRQDSNAPIWNWPNGEQLNDSGLSRVNQFADALRQHAEAGSETLDEPSWIDDYVDYCLSEVPFYRRRGRRGLSLQEIPTCGRVDMAPCVWDFVPDSEPLDELITFSSSGTTGHPTRTPHHPYSAACGVPLMEQAVRTFCGVPLPHGSENVAICNVAAYPGAYTTAIVVAYLREAGCIRVNLDPSAWRKSEDREAYLNRWAAPIWLGDPVAFGALEKLDIGYKPKAILSSIMRLSPTFANRLSLKYECPVLDMYAMTEAGIVAIGNENGHRILPHDLFVEVLDEGERRCAPGARGEIVLTGGRNPYFPLLRYRTGDYASLQIIDGHRVLVGLEGREPVEYPVQAGRVIHSMELTRLMRRYPVLQYEMKIAGEYSYELHVLGDIDRKSLESELADLFKTTIPIIYR